VNIIANRRSRRRVPENRGAEIDFRRTWRKNAAMGPDGVELARRRRRIKKTKLMVLCDVSGSMDCYSRFMIQFIYAVKKEIPDVEVGVFSTRMTVISRLLKTKSVEESLREVADEVHDWAGGTDIGSCIRDFNEFFARDMLRSKTVMMIVSDGWDRGDTGLMRQEMEAVRPISADRTETPLCRIPLVRRGKLKRSTDQFIAVDIESVRESGGEFEDGQWLKMVPVAVSEQQMADAGNINVKPLQLLGAVEVDEDIRRQQGRAGMAQIAPAELAGPQHVGRI